MGIVFNLEKNCEEQGISQLATDWLANATTRERTCEEHMLEVQTTQVSEATCDSANLRLTCERSLTAILCVFPLFLYSQYKAHITHEILRRVA